ncbi:DUF5677 domain-containing protein, partial [Clostridiaceae bacterium HSG29]|nr:DUF5677 domain-containing protein [Clostridiaceae bacterium HSG29]
MTFEKESFLSNEIEENRKVHINNRKILYKKVREINTCMNDVLHNLKHTDNINKDYFLIGLLCKIVKSYNSIILLSEYGLESDVKVLLRSLMETAFNFCAMIYDNEYFEKYLKNADKQNLFFINSIKKN